MKKDCYSSSKDPRSISGTSDSGNVGQKMSSRIFSLSLLHGEKTEHFKGHRTTEGAGKIHYNVPAVSVICGAYKNYWLVHCFQYATR